MSSFLVELVLAGFRRFSRVSRFLVELALVGFRRFFPGEQFPGGALVGLRRLAAAVAPG